MAMSLPHQIGALSGVPIPADTFTTTESPSSLSAAAVWKPPTANLTCKYSRGETDAVSVSLPASPCRSPALSVACQAFATDMAAMTEEAEHRNGAGKGSGGGVPVYVMMPLDSVTMTHAVNRRKAMSASLQALKSAGVEGIMMDVWWGLVEGEAPGVYNWGGYKELMEMARKYGLKVQAVMSFHKCGGNVGDSVTCVL